MKVYLDTGVFIDYFINRSHGGHYLRTGSRRGRTPKKLDKDAVSCLNRISRNHEGFTSSFTLYELEHALFTAMKNTHKGSSHLDRMVLPAARSAVYQGITVAQLYKIKLVDVSESIILKQLGEVELQLRGIMAADSLHIITAIDNDADVIISTDDHMRGLDNVFQNSTGSPIRCVDTDVALTLL